MNQFKKILFIILIVISSTVSAQEMNEGFGYLETGQFDKAEIFFNKILDDYPDNKTANLCYGRAVGLNGNAPKAVGIFTNLLRREFGNSKKR